MKTLAYLIGIAVSAIYIINPGAGVWELIPDNMPLVGNLDEAAVVTILLACLRGLKELRRTPELPAVTPAQSMSSSAR